MSITVPGASVEVNLRSTSPAQPIAVRAHARRRPHEGRKRLSAAESREIARETLRETASEDYARIAQLREYVRQGVPGPHWSTLRGHAIRLSSYTGIPAEVLAPEAFPEVLEEQAAAERERAKKRAAEQAKLAFQFSSDAARRLQALHAA